MNPIPILHVDGSLTEYVDKKGVLHKVAGLGGYLVINGKIVDKFFKSLKDVPHLNRHEDYAVIEGLKWVKEKKLTKVRIKTDSLCTVNLFSHHKKTMCKIDKFFLLQFMMIEYSFELVEMLHHSRSDDDLSHTLSRTYMADLPTNVIRLHQAEKKKKSEYDIVSDAGEHAPSHVTKILCDSMKAIQMLVYKN